VIVFDALLRAVGVDASPVALTGLLGLPVLVGMLSPLPGGAGIREAMMVTVAHVEGLDGASVLVAAVVYRAALFIVVPLLFASVRALGRARPVEKVRVPRQAD
ncbi:MAG: lysylphosphatidylglycerol synthase domain-containing protein, partial [Thermomicrobiales bacterium]